MFLISQYADYRPQWVITEKIDGITKLNNLKYKIDKQIELNPFDILDLIWLPVFSTGMCKSDIILECSRIYELVNCDAKLLSISRKAIALWAGKYITDEKLINIILERLKTMRREFKTFEEQLAGAIFENKLNQAKNKGLEEGKLLGVEEGRLLGVEEGENLLIAKLLVNNSPEFVARELDLPLERILAVKNSK